MQIELYTDLEQVTLRLSNRWQDLLDPKSICAGGLGRLSNQVRMAVCPHTQLLHRLRNQCYLYILVHLAQSVVQAQQFTFV